LPPAGLAHPQDGESHEKAVEEEFPGEGKAAQAEDFAGDEALVLNALAGESGEVAL
jgi:hypothetical protein